jgi:hypothetical protein
VKETLSQDLAQEKCTKLLAAIAAKKQKCLLSQLKEDKSFAETATRSIRNSKHNAYNILIAFFFFSFSFFMDSRLYSE